MVKRAKLTLDPDPVEENQTPAEKNRQAASTGEKKAVKTAKTVSKKESGLFKTVLFTGLAIASIIIFKRKIF